MSSTAQRTSGRMRIATFFTTAALLTSIAPAPAMALVATSQESVAIEEVQTTDDAQAEDLTVLDDQATSDSAAQDQATSGPAAQAANDSAAEDQANAIIFMSHAWNGSEVVPDRQVVSDYKAMPENGILNGGVYYVDHDMTYDQRVEVTGDTWLVLAEGVTLTVQKGDGGVYVEQGKTLEIFAEGNGSGKIVAKPDRGAAIGAYSGHKGGDVVVHGGTVEAHGGGHCAGIGSNDGDEKEVGSFTIYDGTVIARGGSYGAGIGGGQASEGGKITIYNGTVDAKGGKCSAGIGGGNGKGHPVRGAHAGTIEIWNGDITAQGGSCGAGIGGGEGGNAGSIAIHGGNVKATGGADGAGIGGGQCESADGDGGTIEISGGVITAKGKEDASGIGGGENGHVDLIDISGGDVTAVSPGDGAAIGAGEDEGNGKIVISGGKVVTKGAGDGAGIGGGSHSGAGGTIEISGGDITARSECGAGIGGGVTKDVAFKCFHDNNSGDGAKLTITGGKVNAYSGAGFGIGAGGTNYEIDGYCRYEVNPPQSFVGSCGTVLIEGDADVTTAGYLAGIGGDGGSVTIKGGKVTATGKPKSKGVAARYVFGRGIWLLSDNAKLNISGGEVLTRGTVGILGAEDVANGIKVNHIFITGGHVEAYGRTKTVDKNGIAGFDELTIKGKDTTVITTCNGNLKDGKSGCTIDASSTVKRVNWTVDDD